MTNEPMNLFSLAKGAHVRYGCIAYIMLPKHHTTADDNNVLHDVLTEQRKTEVAKCLLREKHKRRKGKSHVNKHEQQNGFHKTATDE